MTRRDGITWRSPFAPPPIRSSTATRVLVWLERKHNPPQMNAPGRMAFGHHIPPTSEYMPRDGWYFDGRDGEERVAAWAYADPPEFGQTGEPV